MRTVSLQLEGRHRELMSAFLCCFCGACEYACPMWLSPRRVYRQTREYLLEEGAEFPRNERILQDNPNRNFRRIPSPRLLSRLGLSKYNVPKKFLIDVAPAEVVIPLKQHIGYPAMSIVESGDRVSQGEVIAEIPEGRQSARIHASIDGKITKITDKTITVKAG